ncbi:MULTISPECIES: AgrD family cyclic lactone autoinducer peptide [Caproicibacterium]|uniref:Cyclic lactone autoinducer peptide n=1 Tax=Caproicibacterium argilliputei TaxID=3030016 RepID=A0AA97DCA9_9FIRM|nr:cyclic lactone autoinducer peptide [Caproicibacterium argilliputei]WOC33194.1 cyclic lactone autoinducer peptide [Caproicibacterium argilliputei]
MKKAADIISKLVKAAAKFGAGATSASFGYQPKTPACLREKDAD